MRRVIGEVPNRLQTLASFENERRHIAMFRRIAHITGPESASSQAIADYDRRMAKGEKADIVRYGSSLIVVGP